MTDRPIIFSAPMVRAQREGRKTQTRRLAWDRRIKPPKGGPIREVTALVSGFVVRMFEHPTIWQRVQPGDRLWVRENWCVPPNGTVPWYAADNGWGYDRMKWRPSIHMPRALSRITLTVTDVRRQRLQDISDDDAVAEGCYRVSNSYTTGDNVYAGSYRAAFGGLWQRLHGAESWDANPEVVALTFTVGLHNIDQQRSAA